MDTLSYKTVSANKETINKEWVLIDAEGEVLERCEPPMLDRITILRVLAEFTGEIEQIPPMHSAIKHQGQRLARCRNR